MAAYLCDRSLSFHTGDSVVVDGGYTVALDLQAAGSA